MTTTGYILQCDAETATVATSASLLPYIDRYEATEVEITIRDKRLISVRQRNKVFALVAEVTDHISAPVKKQERAAQREMLLSLQLLYLIDCTDREAVRKQLTHHFCDLLGRDLFSLSDCDMTTAREFIAWIIDKCVEWDIPTNDTLLNRCEDTGVPLRLCPSPEVLYLPEEGRHSRGGFCGHGAGQENYASFRTARSAAVPHSSRRAPQHRSGGV